MVKYVVWVRAKRAACKRDREGGLGESEGNEKVSH